MKRVLCVFCVLIFVFGVLTGCSSEDSSPNISVEQMKSDLDGQKVPYYWSSLKFGDTVEYEQFEVQKTLSEDNKIQYYVNVSASNLDQVNTTWFESSFTGTMILTYKKYKEGWEFTNAVTVVE